MPVYDYRCSKCGNETTKTLKIADRKIPTEEPCESCGEVAVEQMVGAPRVCDPVRVGVAKQDSGFKEVLKGIHSRTAGSKLNTYF